MLLGDAFELGEHVEVLLSRQLAPQNVELRTHPNVLPYLVYVRDRIPVDDYLCAFHLVGSNHSRQNVYQSGLASAVVAQYSHQLICLNLQSEVLQGLHPVAGEESAERFAQVFDAQAEGRYAVFGVVEYFLPLLDSRFLLLLKSVRRVLLFVWVSNQMSFFLFVALAE